MNPVKLPPALDQYVRLKQEYPDALLFYRMGDFYELFFEDARAASRELGITLTSRNPGAENPVPMAGVPHHAVSGYLAQLLEKGFKIAICDQIEDPKLAKGLVKRAVTRVLTPGTVSEDESLESKAHNYLCAVFWDAGANAGGLAFIDYSTGEFSGLCAKRERDLWQWLIKLSPREIIAPQALEIPGPVKETRALINAYPASPYFDRAQAVDKILAAQGVAQLSTLDLDDKPELVRAMGALLLYLVQTQKHPLSHLGQFTQVTPGDHLLIDEVTERNLELFRRLDGRKGPGTLIHVLDQTLTPMGGRLLETRLRQPWLDAGKIAYDQDAVAFFAQNDGVLLDLRRALDRVYDLERLSTRIYLNRTAPRDFAALRESLAALPGAHAALADAAGSGDKLPAALDDLLAAWDGLDDLRATLAAALVDSPPVLVSEGGLFRPGYDRELDELLELSEHGEAKLKELLEEEQRAGGLPKLKLGYNRVFGYYFELSRAAGQPPAHFVRKQTLAGVERYVTQALSTLEEKLLSASDSRKSMEYKLFCELRELVAAARARLMAMGRALGLLDYYQSLAAAARKWDWVRPAVTRDLDIVIKAGRHPVVEAQAAPGSFIPNDVTIDAAGRIAIITGPNMAGKSTALRQTAIIVILAQMGSFVPAREATIGLAGRVFTRVGASDNLAQGQSTFMVEMTETARILRQAGRDSLVILDEIGRGTSTFDGLSLAWAVVEDLAARPGGGVRTLFATHYFELTGLEGRLPGVRNLNIAVKEYKGDIVFLRRLVPGPADRSYGIEVARLAGVPRPVVARAREILAGLEKKGKQLRGETIRAITENQPLLPGLPAPRETCAQPDPPDEHPLVKKFTALDIDRLTPLEALNLLHEWKNAFGGE
ncbi:MAG: DNA mismatch repair protein MutS [Desulfovibrionaceae bacterium]|nr:DNA mismatch repair protein MutS [Desulfovibrionaceae bacterium]MBF0514057.1 DNA mismatch repair protein MutS [Desulfovibrionaceae bacterium]